MSSDDESEQVDNTVDNMVLTPVWVKPGKWIMAEAQPGVPVMVEAVVQSKSMLTAHLLWLFLGFFGGHRFYLGSKKDGWWMLILFVLGFLWHWFWVGLFLWWLHDGIILSPWVRDYNDRLQS